MATTTNYGWTTPDDTALVKDGAAAIRTLGSSVDTTTKNLNPSTTLGDIEYRSSTSNTNTRLGIGSTGNVLTVAGGVPTWAAPAGGGSSFTLLNAGGTALTAASTITVSGISGKDKILVVIQSAAMPANSELQLRLNADSATNYDYNNVFIQTTASYGQTTAGSTDKFGNTEFLLGGNGTNASNSNNAHITISGANSTNLKQILGVGGSNFQAGNTRLMSFSGGTYKGASTISSVSAISTAGDFTGGTIFVYTSAS